MHKIINFFLVRSNLFIALASFGLVFIAYLFETIGGYEPCPLCLFQRWCFLGMGAMALLRILMGDQCRQLIGQFKTAGAQPMQLVALISRSGKDDQLSLLCFAAPALQLLQALVNPVICLSLSGGILPTVHQTPPATKGDNCPKL